MEDKTLEFIIDLIKSRKEEEISKLKVGGWDSRKDAYCDGATKVCDDITSWLKAARTLEQVRKYKIKTEPFTL